MDLPIIKVTCSFCPTRFECEPDDLIGWDGDKPIYACPKCQVVIDKDTEEMFGGISPDDGEIYMFSDADSGL